MERRSERIFGQRYGCQPVKIEELNMHLMCILCGGYYIDATTIIECLHSFCRSCIVRYLESSSRCPICDVLVHKAQPLLNIRLDHVLQGLVYKLVPGLMTKEMNSRRKFYSHGSAGRKQDQPQDERTTQTASIDDEAQQKFIRNPSLAPADFESLSISLEYLPCSKVTELRATSAPEVESRVIDSAADLMNMPLNEYADVRYLLCPAGFTVGGLKKFIRAKFDLALVYQIDIFYGDECLENHFSMLDVAFIFQWQKKVPLQLRYSVCYVPRTKRKLTASNSTQRQNSKENETRQDEPKRNGERNQTPGQHDLTKSDDLSVCPSRTSKRTNSRTRQANSVDDRRKSPLCKDNGSMRAKQVGCGDEKSALSARRGRSGCRDVEGGEQHECSFEDKPKESRKTSGTNDKRGLAVSRDTVSMDVDNAREKSDGRRVIQYFSETQHNRGKRTRREIGGRTSNTLPIVEDIVYGASENSELTIDLTGDDLNGCVATMEGFDEMRTGSHSTVCPESTSRVVGNVTFVGNGSSTVLASHESVLCSMDQVNGEITKSAITLPCINTFKTLSCELHGHHLGYATDTGQIVGESVMTDDVMKIISTPREMTIVPSFGVQIIYSPDSVVSQNPICGVIQLPESSVSVTSNALTRAPAWVQSDVSTNGIMNDADFQRLCEGKTIQHAEKDFGGCFEHFVMPNRVDGVGGKMSDEVSLSYAVSLDSSASGPLPCVFVAQTTGHQPQNSWSLPESDKDTGIVDWGLCYPVSAAELGAASLASVSDDKETAEQPECSFVCVSSNTLLGSTTKQNVAAELWSQGPYSDRDGIVETVLGPRGDAWTVESRQAEPRAVKMCIVEPQAVNRRAENDRAVEPKEARTSYADSNIVKALQVGLKAVESKAEGILIVERQAVETQTTGLYDVESVPEQHAVEVRTAATKPVEPNTMEQETAEQSSMETLPLGLQAVEVRTNTSSCTVECDSEETLEVESKPKQPMPSERNPLLEPGPEEMKTTKIVVAEQESAQSSNVDAWSMEESLVEPDDVELAEAGTPILQQLKLQCSTAESSLREDEEINSYEDGKIRSHQVKEIRLHEDEEIRPLEDEEIQSYKDIEIRSHKSKEIRSPKDEEIWLCEDEHIRPYKDEEIHSHEDEEIQSNQNEQIRSHEDAETKSHKDEETKSDDEDVCLISLPLMENSLTVLSEDSVDMDQWKEIAVLPLNQHTVIEVNSADCVVENAGCKDGVEKRFELSVEENFLLSGDDPAKFDGVCADWSCTDETKQATFADVDNDVDCELALTVCEGPLPKTEDIFISDRSETSLSSCLEGDAVHLSPKPEHILRKFEDESVSLEEERLVVDVTEQKKASERTGYVPHTSDISYSVDTLNNSYSHLSNSEPLSPRWSSEAVLCSLETIPPTDDIPVSNTSVSHSPVSADDTGVLLVDDSMLVSVNDDHVMVCIREKHSVSVSNDEAIQVGIADDEIPVSDDFCEIPVLEPCNELTDTYDCERTLVADACNGILAPDDRTDIPVSDSFNKAPIADACDKVHVPVITLNVPVSTATGLTATNNVDETDLIVVKDLPVQSRMSFDGTEVPGTTSDDLIACMNSAVSNATEETPVSIVMYERESTNSSAGGFSSFSVPTTSTDLVLTDVSLTTSLESVPVCSSPLDAPPLCIGIPVVGVVYPLAISPLAGGDSSQVAQHDAIKNQVMSTSEKLEEEDLPNYICSTCDLDASSEVVPVSPENPAMDDTNLRSVEINWKDGNVEDSRQLDFTDEVAINGVEESLVTDSYTLLYSFPLKCYNGKSPACGPDQNFGLLDMKDLGEERVPDCGSEIIDLHTVIDNDQKSVKNRVNFLPSDDCVTSCVEKRENNENKALSQHLTCPGSLISSEEECRDYFRSIACISRSFSFSSTSSGLESAITSGSRRRRSRSLGESANPTGAEQESRRAIEYNTSTLSYSRLCCSTKDEELLNETVGGNNDVACGDERSMSGETNILNPNESCVDHVPVSSVGIQPFVTDVQNDTVSFAPVHDVVSDSAEHVDTCKFVAPDTIALCYGTCDNLKANDRVSEKNTGETELGDDGPVDVI